jgi:hypothetical protein
MLNANPPRPLHPPSLHYLESLQIQCLLNIIRPFDKVMALNVDREDLPSSQSLFKEFIMPGMCSSSKVLLQENDVYNVITCTKWVTFSI